MASKPISHSYESTGSTFVPTDVDTAEAQDKPGSSSSVSFHDISYEVSNWCGRKRKIILSSARSVILAVHYIYQCRESWPRPQAAYKLYADKGTKSNADEKLHQHQLGDIFLLFGGGALACLDHYTSWLRCWLHADCNSTTIGTVNLVPRQLTRWKAW